MFISLYSLLESLMLLNALQFSGSKEDLDREKVDKNYAEANNSC